MLLFAGIARTIDGCDRVAGINYAAAAPENAREQSGAAVPAYSFDFGLRQAPNAVAHAQANANEHTYHIMVGLGTIMVAIMGLSALFLWRGRLYSSPALLWALMLSIPFPYIATTAGWMTAELGRQPWVIYGLMRTMNGASPRVSAGNGLFTLLGFMGMYMVLGILFLFLLAREVAHGPEALVSPLEPHPPKSKQVLA